MFSNEAILALSGTLVGVLLILALSFSSKGSKGVSALFSVVAVCIFSGGLYFGSNGSDASPSPLIAKIEK